MEEEEETVPSEASTGAAVSADSLNSEEASNSEDGSNSEEGLVSTVSADDTDNHGRGRRVKIPTRKVKLNQSQ